MHRKITIAIMTLAFGACFMLTAPPASAQRGQGHQAQGPGGGGGGGGGGGQVNAQRRGGGPAAVAPRRGNVQSFTPRANRTVSPRSTRTFSQTSTQRGTRTVSPRIVTPGGSARIGSPGGNARVVNASRLRGVPASGAGRAFVGGRNYSAWRSGYRVRYGNSWRTFIALGALSAIAIGSYQYYPYAYISAPQPYCDGVTEDGCQLRWQDVQTLEGDIISQCVAYCPWQ